MEYIFVYYLFFFVLDKICNSNGIFQIFLGTYVIQWYWMD